MGAAQKYREQLVPEWVKKDGLSSPLAVPRMIKIALNMGLGDALSDKSVLSMAVSELALIAGQRPVLTRARKSVSGFKIRAGMTVGCRVTLRGARMYDFFDRMVNIALPRVRDFRGLSAKSFDGRGNYSLGLREHIVFPEIDYDKVGRLRGLHVTIVTNAHGNEQSYRLLAGLGLPLHS